MHLDFSPSITFFSSTSTVNIQLGQFVKEKSFEIIFSRSVYGVTSHFEMTETPFLSCKWNRKSQLLFMFFFGLLKSHWQIKNKFLQFLLFESKLETCLVWNQLLEMFIKIQKPLKTFSIWINGFLSKSKYKAVNQ